MTVSHTTTVHCNGSGCRSAYPVHVNNADLARHAAGQQGWAFADGEDQCPRCSGPRLNIDKRAKAKACPKCSAAPQDPCRDPRDGRQLINVHRERRKAAAP